jgi:hypothetical protein
MIAPRGRFNLNIADKKYRFVSGPLATRGSHQPLTPRQDKPIPRRISIADLDVMFPFILDKASKEEF